MGGAIQKKLSSSAVADVATVTNWLNEGDGLNTLEKLVETYAMTGIVDRKGAAAVGQFLNADFLVFSRLKAEKMDVTFLSKGTGTSLEVMIVSTATGKIAWGGIWGTGGANPKEVADQLATLALTSLPQATGQYHDLSQLESPQEPATPESATKKRKKRRKSR